MTGYCAAMSRQRRTHYSSEEKIGIVLDGLRGEDCIAQLCLLMLRRACLHAREGGRASRVAPYHSQTQSKIVPRGRLLCKCLPGNGWPQALKNRILLENHFLPGDLEAQIEAFFDHHKHQRSLDSGFLHHALTSTYEELGRIFHGSEVHQVTFAQSAAISRDILKSV